MHKDGTGHVGFVIKKGKVVSIVKGSSAARNGLLTNHYVCEVNGQNVIGLKVGQRPGSAPELRGQGDCWAVGGPPHVCGKAAVPIGASGSSSLQPQVAARIQ